MANLSGKLAEEPGAHTSFGETKTMGHLKGERKPSPDKFRLKNTGTMGSNKLPDGTLFTIQLPNMNMNVLIKKSLSLSHIKSLSWD